MSKIIEGLRIDLGERWEVIGAWVYPWDDKSDGQWRHYKEVHHVASAVLEYRFTQSCVHNEYFTVDLLHR